MPLFASHTRQNPQIAIFTLAIAGGLFLGLPCLASERLETSQTAGTAIGSSNYIYIAAPDRTTLYTHPSDTLSKITIKVHNGTGHNCSGMTLNAFINDAEISGDTQAGVDINNGQDAELSVDFTTNPDIVLSDIYKIRVSVGSCWNGLTKFASSTNVWGSDAGTYGFGPSPYDPYIKIYGLPPDTRPDPAVSVYDPPDDTEADQLVWNAPFTFRITTDINADAYPNEIVQFHMEIKQGERVVYVSPYLPYIVSNTTYEDNYALTFDAPIHFDIGEYSIRAQVKDGLNEWSEWSEPVNFTSTNTEVVPPDFNPTASGLTCSVIGEIGWTNILDIFALPYWTWNEGDGLPCAWSWIVYVITPPANTFDYLFEQISVMATRYPFVRIKEATDALIAAFDAEAGTSEPAACSFFDGSCVNPTWIRHGIQDFYNANTGIGTAFGMAIGLITISVILSDIAYVFL